MPVLFVLIKFIATAQFHYNLGRKKKQNQKTFQNMVRRQKSITIKNYNELNLQHRKHRKSHLLTWLKNSARRDKGEKKLESDCKIDSYF